MRAVVIVVLVLCMASLCVSAARLRGVFDEPSFFQQQQQQAVEEQPQQQQQQQGELISFLQTHQRAFQSQQSSASSSIENNNPSMAAQNAANQAAPAGSGDASGDNVLAALEHTGGHRAHALVQTHSQAQSQSTVAAGAKGPGEDGDGEDFGACKTCVFVLERIKKGSNMLLPAICSELYHKYPDAYALCHQVLNALSINGNNVRYWLFEGCFKYEIYQSKEWIKPCPSHVMCSVLKDLSAEPFCPALPMENPFADA
jgi:hypothetical protein